MPEIKYNQAAAAEPHEPNTVRVAAAPKPRVPATPRFLYCYKPERIAVLHGKIVPNLAKLVIEPGVNCVGPSRDVSAAITERTRKGWIVLPEDVDGSSYLAKRTNHLGRVFWLDRFAKVFNGSAHIGDGSEEYAEWLSGLIAEGLIERPPDYIVEGMRDELSAAVTRLEDRGNRSEAAELRKLQANVKACDDFLHPPAKKTRAAK
jgi:hypothetical protein